MVREDRVIMSVKELRRVHVIRQTREKKLTQVKAGALLGLTPRHIRRLIARVAQAGDQGLAHRGRGKPSNRQIPEPVKTKALTLYEKQYGDVGPTLAAEQLAERHGLAVNAETLRGWLLATGVTHFQRRKRPHQAWRERRAHVGELIQRDGSHHDWFEGRGPRCVLMASLMMRAAGCVHASMSTKVPSRRWTAVWDSAGRLRGQAYHLISRRPRLPWTTSWPG
jgi:hypothetical protein